MGAYGADTAFAQTLSEQPDPVQMINELTFQVKRALPAPDDLPPQDCSVIVLDIEKRAMRLAKYYYSMQN